MPELPIIPGYRIEKELGRGGMATVYMGVQEKLNRKVAIKVLSPLLLQDQNFAKRFLKEAETAANLTHPSIVTIYDVGDSGGNFYIIMEYLEESLKDKILRHDIDPELAMKIVVQVAGALDYAHEKGFVHRDIKPENILFRADGTPVLVDFGIAKAMDAATKLTKTGMSIGTPYYMSPEQGRGETLDGRSDYYSLGVVLYEMLTGKVPYDAENTVGIVIKHIQEPVPMLPQELMKFQPLLDMMMDKKKTSRLSNQKEIKKTGANIRAEVFNDENYEKKFLGEPSKPNKYSIRYEKEKGQEASLLVSSKTDQNDSAKYHLRKAQTQKKLIRNIFVSFLLFITLLRMFPNLYINEWWFIFVHKFLYQLPSQSWFLESTMILFILFYLIVQKYVFDFSSQLSKKRISSIIIFTFLIYCLPFAYFTYLSFNWEFSHPQSYIVALDWSMSAKESVSKTYFILFLILSLCSIKMLYHSYRLFKCMAIENQGGIEPKGQKTKFIRKIVVSEPIKAEKHMEGSQDNSGYHLDMARKHIKIIRYVFLAGLLLFMIFNALSTRP